MRFWDSAALVPLIVHQPQSPLVDQWFGADAVMVVWTLTPVEISSAIQRLLRERTLTETDATDAERRASELLQTCHLVVDVESVKPQAQRLLRLHPLRAADALQLGAAIEWVTGRPTGRTLHTFNTRLAAAARREGFEVPAA